MGKIDIKVIIGLGNPGVKYTFNRHNIGFRVLDQLANKFLASWSKRNDMVVSEINIQDKKILLVKPQTFMNNSGRVIPFLLKKGIQPSDIMVIHDDLELPFGVIKFKFGGSAKGHNGLRSIIDFCGDKFERMRIGIGRPLLKQEVPSYVLSNFSETSIEVESVIDRSVKMIEDFLTKE